MVKRKSSPRRAPATPSKRKRQTSEFTIGTKKFRVDLGVLRTIQKQQNTTKLCIPRLPFSRLIRELLMDFRRDYYRIQVEALQALQEAAEIYLTHLFEDSVRCAYHARRITVMPKDMRLVLDIKGTSDPGYIAH